MNESSPVANARARLDAGAVLSVSDVASLIGVHTKTVRRAIHAGKLPAPDFSLGRKVRGWRAATIRPVVDGDAVKTRSKR